MNQFRPSAILGFALLGVVVLVSGVSGAEVSPALKNLDPDTVVDQPESPPWEEPEAAPDSFDYPSEDSTIVASTGFIDAEQVGYFWSVGRGDSVVEDFSGPASISAYSLDVDVIENVLNSGAFCNWDVIINGVTVDNFTVDQGFVGTVSRSQSFPAIAGPSYTVELRVTNEVADGQGSHTFRYAGVGANQIDLGEAVPATPVTALALLAMLLLVGGAILFRRRQAVG